MHNKIRNDNCTVMDLDWAERASKQEEQPKNEVKRPKRKTTKHVV